MHPRGEKTNILGQPMFTFALHIGQLVRRGFNHYALYLSGIGKIRKQFRE